MSRARDQFYSTIALMRSLQSQPTFVDQGLTPSDHNTKARILRNGLAVSAYALLESYLKDRLEEVLTKLATSSVGYAGLSDELKSFFTVRAIQGFANKLNFLEKNDKIPYAERHIPVLAGLFTSPSAYSPFGFSPKGSNVSPDDVKELPGIFGVANGWAQLSTVCTEVGISRLNLSTDFKNFQKARNSGAHDITSNIASGDLQTHIETALLVGMACDISISYGVDWLCRSTTYAQAIAGIAAGRPSYKIISEQTDGLWAERSSNNTRIIKRYPDLNSAKFGARARPNPNYQHIIARDTSSKPIFIF